METDEAVASAHQLSAYDISMYGYDAQKIETAMSKRPWLDDPKYFKRVKISPSAATKMMMHAQTGVDKGLESTTGNPIEVMGFLVGRIDVDDPNSLVIQDAVPIAADGFETRVVTDDETVMNFMIECQELNELTRNEIFCGWYHTHPFDYDPEESYNHCYLSSTDLQTQLLWQMSYDPRDTPFVAIVIDPLRSIAKGRLELAAFRAYPATYDAPEGQCPDGKVIADKAYCGKRWGAVYQRYYKLDVSFYISSLAQRTLGALKNSISWSDPLTQMPFSQKEHKESELESILEITAQLNKLSGSGGGGKIGGGEGDRSAASDGTTILEKTTARLAENRCNACSSNLMKRLLLRKAAAHQAAASSDEALVAMDNA